VWLRREVTPVRIWDANRIGGESEDKAHEPGQHTALAGAEHKEAFQRLQRVDILRM
jgi:hypothetical protein